MANNSISNIVDSFIEDRDSTKQLSHNESSFQSIVESSPDLIVCYDRQCRRTYINAARAKLSKTPWSLLGKSPEEDWNLPTSTESATVFQAHIQKVLDTSQENEWEFSWIDESKRSVCFLFRGVPEFDLEGLVTGVLTFARDISDRKILEETLAAHAQEFIALAENSPDFITRFDRNCQCTYINPSLGKVLGVQDALGMRVSELYYGCKQALEYQAQILHVLTTGEESQFLLHFQSQCGRDCCSDLRLVPERNNEDMIVSVLAIGRDVIENIRMNETLAKREREFRTLAENSPDMIVRYDCKFRRVFVNSVYARETGTLIEHAINKPIDDISIWRPSMPLDEYKARLQLVMETGAPDQILLEWTMPDGKRNSHEVHVVVELDMEGQVVGTLAIGRNVTEHKATELLLIHQATHDALTGLPNRLLLKDRLELAISHARRNDGSIVVMFIDIDNFKNINDTMGHEVGDALLKLVAERMRSALRECDTVARIGGDEFVILLPESMSDRDLDAVVRKVFDTLSHACNLHGHSLYPKVSMGVARCPQDADDIETLIHNADQAMYYAKRHGRNNYKYFSAEMNQNLQEWMELSADMHHALEHNAFELYYQPEFDVKTGKLSGMEALIRWHHPKHGWISPARFIPIAEDCGLIIKIGAWVLEEACRQISVWLTENLDVVKVAVNLSAVQCYDDSLLKQIRVLLDTYQLQGKMLELEITESVMMHDKDTIIQAFWDLKKMGVHLTIDDFGVGYSSLSYLKRFPVDYLKIDKSFVSEIENNQSDVEIIVAIITMAHSLGLQVVAESVETAEQLRLITLAGCDKVQGHYFSKPLSVREMTDLMRTGADIAEPLNNGNV